MLIEKRLISLFCVTNQESRPESVPNRKSLPSKILKIKNSHDAKQLVRGSSLEVLHNLSILSVKIAQNAPESQIGADDFLTSEIFTLDDPEKSQMGKCLIGHVLSPKSEDSPRSVSTGREPSRKRGGRNSNLATRERFLSQSYLAVWLTSLTAPSRISRPESTRSRVMINGGAIRSVE